jgi:hypothetical protein
MIDKGTFVFYFIVRDELCVVDEVVNYALTDHLLIF